MSNENEKDWRELKEEIKRMRDGAEARMNVLDEILEKMAYTEGVNEDIGEAKIFADSMLKKFY